MRRSELEAAIRAATEIVRQDHVLVIGSQSILGSLDEARLPDRATLSEEVDIAPLSDTDSDLLARRLNALAGEWSEFHERNGFYIERVGRSLAVLPEGWQERLVIVEAGRRPRSIGLCLEPHDLCASKLVRNAQNDRDFVIALVEAGIVDPRLLRNRIDLLPDDRISPSTKRTIRMLARSLERRGPGRRDTP